MANNKLSDFVTLNLTGTYSLADLLDRVVSRDAYPLAVFSDHFNEGIVAYLQPYRRWTALHMFAEFVLDLLLREDLDRSTELEYVRVGTCSSTFCSSPPASTLVTDLMESHGILEEDPFRSTLRPWNERRCGSCPPAVGGGPDLDQIWEVLPVDPTYEKLLELLAEEVFYVLFANRTFLYNFNSHVARWTLNSWTEDPDYGHLLRKDTDTPTLLRRDPPNWAKSAVFYRDRGLCSECGMDVGATRNPIPKAQYDHIVPLANGGLNDVTNLQLLCSGCNNRKRARDNEPSRIYQRWFPAEDNHQGRKVPTLEQAVLSLLHEDDAARKGT